MVASNSVTDASSTRAVDSRARRSSALSVPRPTSRRTSSSQLGGLRKTKKASGAGPAATETMLRELLAHHGEMLSLHQDRVAQEAFVDTARERLSVRRHAALLGLALDDGASARAQVAVDLPAGTSLH